MQKIVDEMLEGIPNCLAVCVAEIDSGMALASGTKTKSLEPELAAAYNAEVVKQKLKAKRALGLEAENIEDILITLTNQYHVLAVVPNNVYFVYVATTKESNLAIIRNNIRKFMPQIVSNT